MWIRRPLRSFNGLPTSALFHTGGVLCKHLSDDYEQEHCVSIAVIMAARSASRWRLLYNATSLQPCNP